MNHQIESRKARIERLMTEINESRIKVELLLREYEMRKARIAALEKEKEMSERKLQERISETVGKDVFPNGVLNKATLAESLLASKENNVFTRVDSGE